MAPDGDRGWFGGSFAVAAPRTGPGSALALGGATIPGFAELTDPDTTVGAGQLEVTAAIPDGTGGWYVAGNFQKAGGVARPGLVRLNADGSLNQAFDAQAAAGRVKALLLTGGQLYVAGTFAGIGGLATQAGLAQLDPSTGAGNVAWAPSITGTNFTVNALAVRGSLIYAGGGFTSGARSNLIAVDAATGAVDTSYNPDPTGGPVNAIVPTAGSLYIGGQFTSMFAGTTKQFLAKIDGVPPAAPALDATWIPNPSSVVYALGTDGTDLYVGGAFNQFGNPVQARLHVAATSLGGTGAATNWYPGDVTGGSNVFAISVANGNVYFGGDFYAVGGTTRHGLAAAAADATGTLQSFAPEPAGTVSAIAATGAGVYAGGKFGGTGGTQHDSLFPVDLTTGAAMGSFATIDWTGSISNDIYAIAVCGNTVYVGGTFSKINGFDRLNAAAFDRTTGALLPWDPASDADVFSIVCGNGVVYLGGDFFNLGATPRNGIAAVDPVSGAPTSWDPGGLAVGTLFVYSMALKDGLLYVGGDIATIGRPSVARPNLAALNTTNDSATAWNPAITNTHIQTLTISGDEIYVGGNITGVTDPNLGFQARTRAAAIKLSDGNPDLVWAPAPDNSVNSFAAAPDGTIYMAGFFTHVSGVARNFLAGVSPGGAVTSWDPSPDANVRQVAVGSDGRVFVAGSFTGFAGRASRSVASFSEPTAFATQPALTSAPVEGQATTCDPGTPGGSLPAPQSVQWQLDGADIAGATATTYTPVTTDVGHALSCHVSQRNLISSVQADSASVTVASVPAAPAQNPPPPAPFDIDGFPTPPPPVKAKSVIATPTSGTVLVLLPGFRTFIPLPDAERIPVHSVIDARHGVVKLTTVGAKGKLQSALFYEGEFQIFQSGGAKPIVELRLYGGNFKVCPRISRQAAALSKVAKTKSIRHLWGNGKGLFRTKGRYASATIRGTKWLTDDRCDGTLVRVAKGAVTVRDLPKKKSLVLKAPKKYLALARR